VTAVPGAETSELFLETRRGAPGAADAFYERCARKLLPLIRLRMGRSLRSEIDSRDVLQSVMLKAVPRLDQVEDPRRVMAWLARIAENEIRDQADYRQRQMRDAARRAPLEDAADVPAPIRQALSQAIANQQLARVEDALESMSLAEREIIVLRKLEELPFAEIGRRLGKSEDACRMAFARAMAALTLRLSGRS
jgi:RNA polymerase sigma-70 factor (ECF subfamily)